MNIGLLGQLLIEQRLVENGWHPVRLDAARMAANADLLAIKERNKVALQVKTTAHSGCFGFGRATRYLRDGQSIFTSVESPIIADVVVAVKLGSEGARYLVLPVVLAEALCRLHCDWWFAMPMQNGEARSRSFPIYLEGGEGSLEFLPEALRYKLRLPLREVRAISLAHPGRPKLASRCWSGF
jgi:hypothetical protein